MPGKVKVKIISGRNLPVMDRSSDTTDAYVEIKLGSTTYKTDVCRKSLHPQWNSEWYRFEVDDSELQDEPLQIRLMDHDTYSANDAIGKVYLDLNPLLLPATGKLARYRINTEANTNHNHSVLSGWIPVYDTMHGIRGEVNVIVKVELFSDFNRFRQSSCGIQFFCSKSIPQGYFAQIIYGFVEELIVTDDPEYQWIDKIRTPRASNEARQTLFFKLSGELQRKIGVKALDLGGNAVIGYCQCFDLEGESGIVARGIGTAVTLVKVIDLPQSSVQATTQIEPVNEERIQNYLKFLGSNSGFRLNINPNNRHPHPAPKFAFSLYNLHQGDPRYSKLPLLNTEYRQLRSTRSNPSLHDHHDPSVRTLLQQEDMRGTPRYGIGQKFKNLKYSSQSILSKKMIALKAKLGDSGIGEEEDILESPAIKQSKKPAEASVMAELLARSVLHAHNSLTCILEKQDSENLVVESSSSEEESSSSSDDDDDDDDDDSKANLNYDTVSAVVKDAEILELEMEKKYDFYQDYDDQPKQRSLPVIFTGNNDEDNPFIFPTVSGDSFAQVATEIEELVNRIDNEELLDLENPCEYNQLVTEAPIAKFDLDVESIEDESTSTIIPQVEIAGGDNIATIKHEGLFKTAIQTLLLDKVNIMGTYTPPLSPGSTHYTPTSSTSSVSGLNTVGYNLRMPRATTALSLDELGRKHDTVLGAPFVSMCNIRRQFSHPCFSHVLSDSALNATPQTVNRGKFVSLLSRNNDSEVPKGYVLKRGVSHDHIAPIRRKFSFFHRRKSHDPTSHGPLKKAHSDDHGRFPFFRNPRSRQTSESDNNTFKKHGLVNAALGSVVRETVQDILATAGGDNQSPSPTYQEPIGAPQSDTKVKSDRFSFLRRKHDSGIKKHGLVDAAMGSVVRETVQDILATAHESPPPPVSPRNSETKVKGGFNFFGRRKSPEAIKKHGLVDAALSNVVMETVQDILATAGDDRGEANPPPGPLNNYKIDTVPLKVNTEIESVRLSNNTINMHASLTPCPRTPLADSTTQPVDSGTHHPINHHHHHRTESVGTRSVHSPAKLNTVPCIYRRSSDSDLSITPKGSSLTGSDRGFGGALNGHGFKCNNLRATVPQDNFDMLEYPFLTMSNYPPGFIVQLGGAVSARSVKLLERISNLEEPESRDTWWSEIRMEIRSHARALNCNAVLGYCETISICEDVCVLSANGTAAVIGFSPISDDVALSKVAPHDISETSKDKQQQQSPEHELMNFTSPPCSICHLPYNTNSVPIRPNVLKCASCRNGKVSDVLIATIEGPENIPTIGRGCFIQSYVCRPLKDLRGESNAKEISDGLPFLEYELHRLLINKLKIKGMNAIFGLKIRISIGEKLLVGIATGTAVFLTPLPTPTLPKLVADRNGNEKKVADLQKLLSDTVKKNREIYQLLSKPDDGQTNRVFSDDDSEEEPTSIDLSLGNKDCCVLEVDDPEDAEVVKMLVEERPPDGFHVVNTEFVPGLEEIEIVKNLQMFSQIYRAKFQPPYNFDQHFHRLLQSVYFKLRRMVPCALCHLQFRVDLPENDEVQLCVLGMALGLGDVKKPTKPRKNNSIHKKDDDLIFNLEEDQIPENSVAPQLQNQFSRIRQKSPSRNRIQTIKQRHAPHRDRHGVDITPLSYIPGGKIEHYLGNLNFFFIRETTSIREEGGLSGFIHSFATEVLAIVRAHVTALGGNAMVAYFLTECVLNYNLHKNQGQCLINVGGDVVFVSYFKEDS